MDLVSIIIPYYKKKSFFKDTINSVKSQTYKNLEIIVIFDDNDPNEFKFAYRLGPQAASSTPRHEDSIPRKFSY